MTASIAANGHECSDGCTCVDVCDISAHTFLAERVGVDDGKVDDFAEARHEADAALGVVHREHKQLGRVRRHVDGDAKRQPEAVLEASDAGDRELLANDVDVRQALQRMSQLVYDLLVSKPNKLGPARGMGSFKQR